MVHSHSDNEVKNYNCINIRRNRSSIKYEFDYLFSYNISDYETPNWVSEPEKYAYNGIGNVFIPGTE